MQSARDLVHALKASLQAEKIKKQSLALDDPDRTLALARASLEAARAAAVAAQEQRDGHFLKSPADGTVLRVAAVPGQVLGMLRTEPVVWVLPDRPWVVRCEIEQEFANRVHVGMTCEVYNDRLTGPQCRG